MALTKTQLEYARERFNTKFDKLIAADITSLVHPGVKPQWTDSEVIQMVLSGSVLGVVPSSGSYRSLRDWLVLPEHPDYAAWEMAHKAWEAQSSAIKNLHNVRRTQLLDQIFLLDSGAALDLIQKL